jgi:hypothetical protein
VGLFLAAEASFALIEMLRSTQTDTSSIPASCGFFKSEVYGKQIYGEGGFRNTISEQVDEWGTYINGGGLDEDLRLSREGSPEEQTQKAQTLQTFKANLRTGLGFLKETNNCLMEEIKHRDRLSFEIYQRQEQLNLEKESHDKIQSSVEAAEIRAQQASSPYEKTTAWESWLPLGGRPLEVNSIPILIGIACLFLVVALGLFLQMASIRLEIHSPLNAAFGYIGERLGTKE